ncbi:hypothetical protein [uncultured Psychrobacter sp.]|uniref:hypothetical protein n=1 Tax=uncultured Psychrobacter sp. TaxID=259303 RepID=UPI0030DC8AC6
MKTQINKPKHINTFLNASYACKIGASAGKDIVDMLKTEAAMLDVANSERFVFSTEAEGVAFYHKHREGIILVNEQLAYEAGQTTQQCLIANDTNNLISSNNQASDIIYSTPTPAQADSAVYVYAYNILAANAVKRTCEKYKIYVIETDADNAIEKFFEYRDENQLDELISWHLGERAINMLLHDIGSNVKFLELYNENRPYSMATDGIHYEFTLFDSEEFDGFYFMQKDGFKYYQDNIIDTIFDGMQMSDFKGYMPTKSEVEKYVTDDIHTGRMSYAGVSITVWNIEQIINQLLEDYREFVKTHSKAA